LGVGDRVYKEESQKKTIRQTHHVRAEEWLVVMGFSIVGEKTYQAQAVRGGLRGLAGRGRVIGKESTGISTLKASKCKRTKGVTSVPGAIFKRVKGQVRRGKHSVAEPILRLR